MVERIEEIRADFASRFKDWRAREGLSQSQAAKRLGVSVRTLQNWEIEKAAPRGFALKMLDKIINRNPKPKK